VLKLRESPMAHVICATAREMSAALVVDGTRGLAAWRKKSCTSPIAKFWPFSTEQEVTGGVAFPSVGPADAARLGTSSRHPDVLIAGPLG